MIDDFGGAIPLTLYAQKKLKRFEHLLPVKISF